MKKLFAVCLFALCAITASAQTQITDEYRAEVKTLLEVTQAQAMMEEMMVALLNNIVQQAGGQMPANFDVKGFANEAAAEFMKLTLNDYAELYSKHFTLEDLKAVNAFYRTPAGKKFAAATPALAAEGAQIGAKYGPQLVEIIKRHLGQ